VHYISDHFYLTRGRRHSRVARGEGIDGNGPAQIVRPAASTFSCYLI